MTILWRWDQAGASRKAVEASHNFLAAHPYEEFDDGDLTAARELLRAEMERVKTGMGHGDLTQDAYAQVWEECLGQVLFVPSQNRYTRYLPPLFFWFPLLFPIEIHPYLVTSLPSFNLGVNPGAKELQVISSSRLYWPLSAGTEFLHNEILWIDHPALRLYRPL